MSIAQPRAAAFTSDARVAVVDGASNQVGIQCYPARLRRPHVAASAVPDAHDPTMRHAPMMTTAASAAPVADDDVDDDENAVEDDADANACKVAGMSA